MKKIIFLLYILHLISCNQKESSNNNLLINSKLQKELQSYLNFPPQYQEPSTTLSILNDITRGDTNVINQLAHEIQSIKDKVEMDSIFRVFTEEAAFNAKTLAKLQESYRLTIFTHLVNTIDIIKINHFNEIYDIAYRKYRINDCQPPIVSGKPLEKSCFVLMEKQERKCNEKDWKALQIFVNETDFWSIPLTHFSNNCFDGSNWTIEGWRHGEYKVIDSRCPGDYNPIKILGESLLNLAKS